jgi:myo-inositol-1(or 4)-monophosphatase
MQPLLNIAVSAARLAGEIILRHTELVDRVNITTKHNNELFSEIDVKAEQAIIQAIHKAHPTHGIIAEESGVHNPEADHVWIIDPLDGTSNYLHGFPFYCVSIAVRVKGRIEHGVVYDPLRHEFFTASRGRGAQLNDRRIRVSKKTQLQESLLASGYPFRKPELGAHYFKAYEALTHGSRGIRRTGSAALDLAYVATGRLDAAWECGLRPWDMAAGSLLITEAGGLVSDAQGGDSYLTTGNIVAGTPKVFKSLLQLLMPHTKMIGAES